MSESHNMPKINGQRLWNSIMEMARIGPGEQGGSCRMALTDEDRQGRDLFVKWCREAGCTVTVDDMGNIFARRPGLDDRQPPVCAGSHLDTQPHGGKFDGIYGVLSALEVVRTLNEHDIRTRSPLEIVNWTNEEGARFAPAMLASGVFASLFDKEYAWSRRDAAGNVLRDELEHIGYLGDQPCGEHPMSALFEAHIEQGPILEKAGRQIGIVTGGQGQKWFDITLSGQDSHAGSTPMPGRRDALVAAAEVVCLVREIALSHAPHGVGTVGQLAVTPNSRNTIPGQVFLTVDLRNPDQGVLDAMSETLETRLADICRLQSITYDCKEIWHNPPIRFDPACIAAVTESAKMLGYGHLDIVSGAGHDACQVCRVVPTAMIFVPCEGGLSHNEAEHAEPDDLEAGCNVLLHAMLAIAGTQT